jgi:hypothetical protein
VTQLTGGAEGESREQKQRRQSDDDDGEQEHVAYLAVVARSIPGDAAGTVDFEDHQQDAKAVEHAVDQATFLPSANTQAEA